MKSIFRWYASHNHTIELKTLFFDAHDPIFLLIQPIVGVGRFWATLSMFSPNALFLTSCEPLTLCSGFSNWASVTLVSNVGPLQHLLFGPLLGYAMSLFILLWLGCLSLTLLGFIILAFFKGRVGLHPYAPLSSMRSSNSAHSLALVSSKFGYLIRLGSNGNLCSEKATSLEIKKFPVFKSHSVHPFFPCGYPTKTHRLLLLAIIPFWPLIMCIT